VTLKKIPRVGGADVAGGEHLVLIDPHLQHDGRRRWVVMAVYDADEFILAANLATAYEGRGHRAAVAQVIAETVR
jgi:hypothetical protein